MLIKFVLVSGKNLTLECDPNDKVKDIIPNIMKGFQLDNYNTVRLIYKGKKLDEDDEIKSAEYVQGQIIIVQPQGKKNNESSNTTGNPSSQTPPPPISTPPISTPPISTPPQASSQPPISLESQPSQPPNSIQPQESTQSSIPESSQPPQDGRPPPDNTQSSHSETVFANKSRPPVLLPDPENWESNLNSLIEMGFDGRLAVRALIQAYNQPDRAVELLMSDAVTPGEDYSSTDQIYTDTSNTYHTESTESPLPNTNQELQPESNSYLQNTSNDYQNNDVSSDIQNLPEPQERPYPNIQSQEPLSYPFNINNNYTETENSPRERRENVRRVYPDLPPTDPTIDPDEDFEFLRQSIIQNPTLLDHVYELIQKHYTENNNNNEANTQNDIINRITENQSLFFHLLGIPLADPFIIPESFTSDDIASVNRLHQLGEFTWDQVVDAYEDSERKEDLASAILLSLNVYN